MSAAKEMGVTDIVFLIVLFIGLWKGWSNGLLKEVLGLIGFFVGLYAARLLYQQVGSQLAPHLDASPTVANVVAFILIWMGVPVLLSVAGSLMTKLMDLMGLGTLNRLSGSVLSCVKYALLLGVLCNVIAITRLVSEETLQQSQLFDPLRQTTAFVFDLAMSQWK